MYHSETYTRAGKTNNNVVKISADGTTSEFVKTQKFVVFNDLHCYILCRELLDPVQAEPAKYMPKHVKERCVVPKEHYFLNRNENLKCICAFVEISTIQYVCDIPNFYIKDYIVPVSNGYI